MRKTYRYEADPHEEYEAVLQEVLQSIGQLRQYRAAMKELDWDNQWVMDWDFSINRNKGNNDMNTRDSMPYLIKLKVKQAANLSEVPEPERPEIASEWEPVMSSDEQGEIITARVLSSEVDSQGSANRELEISVALVWRGQQKFIQTHDGDAVRDGNDGKYIDVDAFVTWCLDGFDLSWPEDAEEPITWSYVVESFEGDPRFPIGKEGVIIGCV